MLHNDFIPSIPLHLDEKYSIMLILAWPDTVIKNIPT